MSSTSGAPVRLASEDIIINAPLSYAGSAQRILRIRRRDTAGVAARCGDGTGRCADRLRVSFVTAWYLIWGLWLVPYRILRRGARKRKAEALRHRELMGTIQGSAAASAAVMVAGMSSSSQAPQVLPAPDHGLLIADVDRERTCADLRGHMLEGRLTAEEFETRVGSAHRARTLADLEAARTGLPATPIV